MNQTCVVRPALHYRVVFHHLDVENRPQVQGASPDFNSSSPMIVGWNADNGSDTQKQTLPAIEDGAQLLQNLVNTFNAFGLTELKTSELLDLISSHQRLFARKVEEKAAQLPQADRAAFHESIKEVDLSPVKAAIKMSFRMIGSPRICRSEELAVSGLLRLRRAPLAHVTSRLRATAGGHRTTPGITWTQRYIHRIAFVLQVLQH